MTTTCSCTWLLTQQESEINLSSPAKQFALHFFFHAQEERDVDLHTATSLHESPSSASPDSIIYVWCVIRAYTMVHHAGLNVP